jgi:SNF2 family DNA or RNA helicase
VILEEFETTEGCAVLFVNPTVGGQGLDMVAANHVFHMNPAWNPAKTDQATFRVNRPGQTRETWSHHLFFDQTIESSIVQLVSEKRELSESALTVAELESNKNQTSQLQLLKNEGKRGNHVGRV